MQLDRVKTIAFFRREDPFSGLLDAVACSSTLSLAMANVLGTEHPLLLKSPAMLYFVATFTQDAIFSNP
jgi:hypothetical protein